MPDVKFSDGREVDIDLYRVSIKEWRALLKADQEEADEYATLAKIIGWKPKDVEGLPYPDFRLLGTKVAEKATSPLSDPNS